MRVKIRLMRQLGRNMHQKEQLEQPPFVGELSVSEGKDHELGRQVKRARLRDITKGTEHDILPELSDVQILHLGSGTMRLAGFELVNKAAYAQTWSIETG